MASPQHPVKRRGRLWRDYGDPQECTGYRKCMSTAHAIRIKSRRWIEPPSDTSKEPRSPLPAPGAEALRISYRKVVGESGKGESTWLVGGRRPWKATRYSLHFLSMGLGEDRCVGTRGRSSA